MKIIYTLNRSDKEFNYDWNSIYGKLDKGTYRIAKEFTKYVEGKEDEVYTLVSEFVIE